MPEKATEDEIVGNLVKADRPAHARRGRDLGALVDGREAADPRAWPTRSPTLNKKRAEADRVLLCVDGVHGFGVEQESVGDLGCDFFVAGCHKWMFGPRGTGIVWGRADAWKGASAASSRRFDWAAFKPWMQGKTPDVAAAAARA